MHTRLYLIILLSIMKNYLIAVVLPEPRRAAAKAHKCCLDDGPPLNYIHHSSPQKCACKPPRREVFLNRNCSNFLANNLQGADQSRSEQLLRQTLGGQDAGSTPQRRLLRERDLFSLQPVPKCVLPNGLHLSENKTFTLRDSSGGHTRGSHPPLLGADLVFGGPAQGQNAYN